MADERPSGETPPDAETADFEDVEGSLPDVLLISLVELIERLDDRGDEPLSVSVTATIPGGVVSGLLVPRRWWVDEATRELTASDPNIGRAMGSLFTELRPLDGALPAYFHLRDARLIVGPGNQHGSGMLWRGRLADVSGWSFTQIR
ncbi:hypothetical protein [Aeromicrobium chenweiae]|uniref:Uncharacterized protein n=1 Tax=Aeromicrobium chenweiae TaxID=2079793 RepID=A0A2S0WRC0_9ACTN|nr:hypothetical protein [Aeromicrobium chenweiae]AWB93867.1 hypothetical protein C3E78_17530 [Aeromicrobium chenweiae]TGN30912.1 hypothetical protein E4L97_14945 [Aeromicrobium chenweiae]